MAYLDIVTSVILTPVPHVEIVVFDSLADLGSGTIQWSAAGVKRTNADGTVEDVRSLATTNADSRSVFVDYECPQQESVTYQAVNPVTAGAPAPISDPVMMPDVGAWLLDPSNPTGAVPLRVQQGGFSGWNRASTVSTTPIYGRALPHSVESSVRQAPTGDVSVWVYDSDTYAALQAILAVPGPKLFSWPRRQWKAYGQFAWAFIPQTTDTPGVGMSVRWGVQLTVQPCARPAVVFSSFGSSWLDEAGQTWADAALSAWGDA